MCIDREREKVTGKIVALKETCLNEDDEGVPTTIPREVSLLRMLPTSPYVVRLMDVKHGKNREGKTVVYLVFDYMDTDLKKYISSFHNTGEEIPTEVVKSLMYQLCKGVAFCHGHGVLHRDLKPHDILMDTKTMLPKIADLGFARAFTLPIKKYTHEILTLLNKAPESFYFLQLLHIFRLLGTPNEEVWPGVTKFKNWHEYPQWGPKPLSNFISCSGDTPPPSTSPPPSSSPPPHPPSPPPPPAGPAPDNGEGEGEGVGEEEGEGEGEGEADEEEEEDDQSSSDEEICRKVVTEGELKGTIEIPARLAQHINVPEEEDRSVTIFLVQGDRGRALRLRQRTNGRFFARSESWSNLNFFMGIFEGSTIIFYSMAGRENYFKVRIEPPPEPEPESDANADAEAEADETEADEADAEPAPAPEPAPTPTPAPAPAPDPDPAPNPDASS